MLRTWLISAVILVAPPAQAASLVLDYVIERGDAARVKDVPGADASAAAAVDVVFGMGRSADAGFVAAAGGTEDGVTVSRGPQAAICREPGLRLP